MCEKQSVIGRTAVGEIIKVNREIADSILEEVDVHELQAAAQKAGMVPLYMDVIDKVRHGIVDIADASALISEARQVEEVESE